MRLGKDTRFVVVGAGLIGGSLVAALRKSGAHCRFVCVDQARETRREALRSGLFDEAHADVAGARPESGFVFVAVPAGSVRGAVEELAPFVGRSLVAFDSCSVKRPVDADTKEVLGPEHARRFVLCHPIAGREFHGIRAADPALFRGRDVVMCPHGNDRDAVRAVAGIWRRVGARVRRMDVVRHDELFAVVSHLPHMLAFALVETIGRDPDKKKMLDYAAGGFRDFTRIASSSPRMWADILAANSGNMLDALGDFERTLANLKAAVRTGDRDALLGSFELSKELRNRWIRRTAK